METSIIRFHDMEFDREQATIIIDGSSVRLEFQQVMLLNFLIDNHDSIVSRDQIADVIWHGVIVEDNTINKAITRLRKVLNDSAKSSQIIKTVPKKGYQFIAKIESVESCQRNVLQQITVHPSPKTLAPMALIVALVFITGLVTWIFTQRTADQTEVPSTITSGLPQPISYREGVELNAHLHPDQNTLLFVGDSVADNFDGYGIYVKQIGQSEARLLTRLNSRYVYPKWLNSNVHSKQLVFSDLDEESQCQIYRLNVGSQITIEVIATCITPTPVELFVVSNQNAMYWTDNAGSWRLDLSTGERKEVIYANKHAKFQMPSPDESLWASIRDVNDRSLVSVYNPKTRQIVMEKQLPYNISHFKWSPSNSALFHLGEHPSNQLYRLSLSGEQQLLASTSLGFMTRISDLQTEDSIEFIISLVDLDIHQYHQGQDTKLANSPFADYNPALSTTSQHLAFASKRTGAAQVWIKQNNNPPQQLSQFSRAGYIYEMTWSPDEQKLLVKRNESVHVFDIESRSNKALSLPASDKVAWQWLSNQTIAYVDRTTHSLLSFNLESQNTELLNAHVGWAQYQSNQWFVSDPSGQTVTQLNYDFSNPNVLTQNLSNRFWVMSGSDLFAVNQHNDKLATLVNIVDDNRQPAIYSGNFKPSSVRSTPQGHLVLQKLINNEATVFQLKLK